MDSTNTHVVFAGDCLLKSGSLTEVLAAAKLALDGGKKSVLLIFENGTGKQVDFDFRGSLDQVLERVRTKESPKGPGRPKLGVESGEVTLLPRHWAWLQDQPNGASAALRRLVEQASRREGGQSGKRKAVDAAYHFMSAMAGNRTGFEETSRALFADDDARLKPLMSRWPKDVREHVLRLLGKLDK